MRRKRRFLARTNRRSTGVRWHLGRWWWSREGGLSQTALSLAVLVALAANAMVLFPISDSVDADTTGSRDSNDSFDTAEEVINNTQTPVSYLGMVDDPNDYYWVSLIRGQALEAHMIILKNATGGYDTSNPGKINFDLEVYGPWDHSQPLAWSRTTDQFETVSIVATSDGKYHFRLYAVNGTGPYNFMVKLYTPPTVSDGGVYGGYLKHDSNDDTDWYKVYLNGGDPAGFVYVNMSSDNTGNFDLFLMDHWHAQKMFHVNVSWSTTNYEERVYGVASYSGLYYIKVNAFTGFGNYQIRVDTGQVPTDNDNDKGRAHGLDYNTTWTGHLDQATNKYDFFLVRLVPQENITIDFKLLNNWADIYAVFLLDVDLNVVSERTNYILTPSHHTVPDIEISQIVSGGVYFVAVQSRVALAANPDDLSDGTAAADYNIIINMSKHAIKPPNRAPVVRPGFEDMVIRINEDSTLRMNLNDVFMDPDGEKLSMMAMVVGGALTVSVDLSGLMTLIPGTDWFGEGLLNLSASDPSGQRTYLDVNVTVKGMPEPPIITDYGPARNAKLSEGTAQRFYVVVMDKDSSLLFYNWSVDGAAVDRHTPELTWVPDYDTAGPHTIEVRISDGTTIKDWAWDIIVNNTNRAPRVTSLEPKNGTKFQQGKMIGLTASLEDPDNDQLSYQWREGLQLLGLGSGARADLNKTFSPGKHTVVVTVNDPSGSASNAEVTFTVEKKENAWDWGMYIVGALVVVVLLSFGVSYLRRPKRKKKDGHKKDDRAEPDRRRGGRRGKAKKERSGRKEKKGEGLDDEIEKEIRAERQRMVKMRKRGGK